MSTPRQPLAFVALALVALDAGGCRRDAEVLALVDEFDTFTAVLLRKVDSSPDPSAGLDDAQAHLDANRTRLARTLVAVRAAHGFPIADRTKHRAEASLTQDAYAVAELRVRHAARAANDPAFRARLEKLIHDYQELLALHRPQHAALTEEDDHGP